MLSIFSAGFALLCMTFFHLEVSSVPFPSGTAKTECRDRYFWIWMNKTVLGRSSWRYSVINNHAQHLLVTDRVAAQCGFTSDTDLHGNPVIRISFLACSVHNLFDQEFSLRLQVEVTNPANLTVTYDVSKKCTLDVPWSPREIVCEENYMEVSVRRAVPGIASEAIDEDWVAVWPVAKGAMNEVWQVVFHFQNATLQNMMATKAHELGYGVNTTATRVLFRSPYSTQQTEVTKVHGLDVQIARATVFYKQSWMILMVDTAVACPINPPVFTSTTLSWVTPRLLPSLVKFPKKYQDEAIDMGLDGSMIAAAAIRQNGYTFLKDKDLISITVPIGAPGGLTESDVINNHYGTTYNIKLLLDRRWKGDESDRTRHRSMKTIRTPFAPHTPVLINNTNLKLGYFDVSLGNFFPDVVLDTIDIGGKPLTPGDLGRYGFLLKEFTNPNKTRVFTLQVPFADPLVEQQYLRDNIRRYTLHLNYTLILTPKDKPFTHPGVIECEVPDVVLPTFKGFCGEDHIGLEMTHGNIDRYWIPYVGNLPLTNGVAVARNYTVEDDGKYFRLSVPLFAAGLVYKDISLQGLVAGLDFNLRDNKTYEILIRFPFACTFATRKLLVCFPNGTMAATVLSLDTKPALDPRRTHLRDRNCGPVAADDSRALFSFPVASCGTTRKFEGNYLVYENEVTFRREVISQENSMITRDSRYRLTLICRYPLKENLRVWARRLHGQVTPVTFAFQHQAPLQSYRQKRSAGDHIVFQEVDHPSEGVAETWSSWIPTFCIAVLVLLVGLITLTQLRNCVAQ